MIMINFKESKAKEQEINRKAFSLNKEEYIISSNRVPLKKKKTTREILSAKPWTWEQEDLPSSSARR